MSTLTLYLLGTFQVKLGSTTIHTFKSDKVRALLAYLAVEADRPHRREQLAALLWPEQDQRGALANLRYTLYDLRKAIDDHHAAPPWLEISRETLQLNPAADGWSDAAAFRTAVGAGVPPSGSAVWDPHSLEKAVDLYRGPFLAGFSLEDTPTFEEWLIATREWLAHQTVAALIALADHQHRRGAIDRAVALTRRLLEIEPWREKQHQRLMRWLAQDGQRSAALAQYERCRRFLSEELDVAPAPATTDLYTAIRDGELRPPVAPRHTPPARSGRSSARFHEGGPVVFTGRERELDRMTRALEAALAGQGGALFVTGEAGSGKTELVRAFARRAMADHPMLVAVCGDCNTPGDLGDPYLPFREILQRLTGDVEAKRAGGTLTGDHARRLWEQLPEMVEALLDKGPHLIGRLVPIRGLLSRAGGPVYRQTPWSRRLAAFVDDRAADETRLEQPSLFEEVTRVLQTLARRTPLLLIVDDLHWADEGTLNLLFHLARRLADHRILLIATYRPASVAQPPPGGTNAAPDDPRRLTLATIVREVRAAGLPSGGDPLINLDDAGGRAFVDALLDREANRLDEAFRAALTAHTAGNALFTVELLRALQDRGDLVRDAAGRWVMAQSDPHLMEQQTALPGRIEAVIAERIAGLTPVQRAILSAAAVEGNVFTAEVVARTLELERGRVTQQLSGPLSKVHRLVNAESIHWLDEQQQALSRYRFRHALFQAHLYRNLDLVERAHLHAAVGEALAAFYGEDDERITRQLAYHFEQGGQPERAAALLLAAGRHAVYLSAYEEAIALLNRGLALIRPLPSTPERAQLDLNLRMALSAPLLAKEGWNTAERRRIGEPDRRRWDGSREAWFQTLFHQADIRRGQGDYAAAIELGEQLTAIARETQQPAHRVLAHWSLGESHFFAGELAPAQANLERTLAINTAPLDRSWTDFAGLHPGTSCRVWLAWILWARGYPDRAMDMGLASVETAREIKHPLTHGMALALGGAAVHQWHGRFVEAGRYLDEVDRLIAGGRWPLLQVWNTYYRGKERIAAGQPDEAIALIQTSLEIWDTMQAAPGRARFRLMLAQTYQAAGRPEAARRIAEEGMAIIGQRAAATNLTVDATGAMEGAKAREDAAFGKAESWTLYGTLLAAQGRDDAAEAALRHAIDLTRAQDARMWELEATTALARLWLRRGRGAAAYRRLHRLYAQFNEGLDTPPLRAARALLDRLDGGAA
jgi:DNA-binding SARP family transcriptional activator/predicted ATPase